MENKYATDAHHDSDNECPEFNSTNQIVKNDDAIKNFNVFMNWAEENNTPLHHVLVIQRLRETAFIINQRRTKQTKMKNYFKKNKRI